jgi:DNA helicase HerA-like ATPase
MTSSSERSSDERFREAMAAGYALDEPALRLGAPMLGEAPSPDLDVRLAISMVNRHGLIAGATGTGKTKTLQLLAGQLSDQGVPVFVADVKGDLTGLAAPGEASERVLARCASIGWTFSPRAHPVEFLSLSGALGAQVRATVSSFGPLLLSKVLDLNETQTSVLSLVFAYCDDNDLPLLDLADLETTLKYLASDEGKPILAEYGGMSTATVGVILRAIMTARQAGAGAFFGEPEFDVADLLRTTPEDAGMITVLELSDVMDRPRLFSTFMLWLLAQLYAELPEVGDPPKPKLTFFFDEAHLLFDDASEALMEQVERTVRLIRSKGVGVYFVTQAPTDVPASVLAQLGHRVQHALRAFTPDDADALRKTARTFPMTDFYDVERQIIALGTGEALVTVLSPRGVPTPLAATRLGPPDSLMAALDPTLFAALARGGALATRYAAAIDRESAHEMISARIASAKAAAGGGTGSGGEMTPAARRAAEAAERRAATAQRQAEARAKREHAQAERERARAKAAAEREAARTQREVIRAGSRVLTSRATQSLIRGVFDTFFGKR